MGFESIHNYYESLVSSAVQLQLADMAGIQNQGVIDDITCLALNQLPARYVRHTVDLMFYMSSDERTRINCAVQEAVRLAILQVTAQHPPTLVPGAAS